MPLRRAQAARAPDADRGMPGRGAVRRAPSPAGRAQARFGNAGTAALLSARNGAAPVVRPKLELGTLDNPQEREAEAVADRVVRRSPDDECGACALGKPCTGGTVTVRRSAAPTGRARGLSAATEAGIQQATRGGEPLPAPVRAGMEPRFGADFGGVRIHRDADAAASAGAIGARAYTLGHDIAFGAGQWAPGTERGDRLIAHELTHTLQDGGSAVRGDFFDDVADLAGDAYDTAASAAGEVYDTVSSGAAAVVDTVSSTASTVVDQVTQGVTAVAETIADAGHAVASAVADVAAIDTSTPEATRADLIGRIGGARQRLNTAGPSELTADAAQVATLNGHISSLNAIMPAAALPLIGPAVGVSLGELLADIAALVLGAAAAEILIIAIIVIAIIALILWIISLFLDSDGTFTKPKVEPRVDPKDDPKDKPDPKKKPDDPPPPIPVERPKPDCCPGPTPRDSFKVTDKKHPYFGQTVEIKDNRNKHTFNIVPSNGGRCDVASLEAVVSQDATRFGPCLNAWIAAANAGNRRYGSQMGSDTVGSYIDDVKSIINDRKNQIDKTTWFGDTGSPCGVDITVAGSPAITDKARVDSAPAQAHIIPIETP